MRLVQIFPGLFYNNSHIPASSIDLDRRSKCNCGIPAIFVILMTVCCNTSLENSGDASECSNLFRIIKVIKAVVNLVFAKLYNPKALNVHLETAGLQNVKNPLLALLFLYAVEIGRIYAGYNIHRIKFVLNCADLVLD